MLKLLDILSKKDAIFTFITYKDLWSDMEQVFKLAILEMKQ